MLCVSQNINDNLHGERVVALVEGFKDDYGVAHKGLLGEFRGGGCTGRSVTRVCGWIRASAAVVIRDSFLRSR